jgi:hypothetical protein
MPLDVVPFAFGFEDYSLLSLMSGDHPQVEPKPGS